MIPEITITLLSIAALMYIAVIAARQSWDKQKQYEYNELHDMMDRVYNENEMLRSDLYKAGKHLTMLETVNNNLKLTIDNLSAAKADVLNEIDALRGTIKLMQDEVTKMSREIEPTIDEMEEWVEQAKINENERCQHTLDLFKSINSHFTPNDGSNPTPQ